MTKRLDDLLLGMEEGTLASKEVQELNDILRQDATARRSLVQHNLLTGGIIRHLGREAQSPFDYSSEQEPTRRPLWLNWGLAAAAAILVVGGMWWFAERDQRSETAGQIVAHVTEVRGEQQAVSVKGDVVRLTVGAVISKGDTVATLADASVTLLLLDQSRIALGEKTRLTIDRQTAKRPYLSEGVIVCSVTKQAASQPLIFVTPHAEAKVLGTELTLSAAPDTTVLKVTSGNVLLTRLADDRSVNVGAGQFATVAPGVELVVQSMEAQKPEQVNKITTSKETVVFLREFERISQDEWTPNELVRMEEAGGEVTAIVSMPWTPKSPTFRPDVYIDLTSTSPAAAGAEVLYTIPENVEIRIRMKSENPGKWSLTQMPSSREFDDEHFYSGEYEVGPEWHEFVLHSGDMKPYTTEEESTRDLLPGVAIRDFNILGYGTGRLYVDRFEVVSLSGTGK